MRTAQLDQPVLEDGLRDVRFANGRVLTAEDLRDEQEAGRRRSRRLGRAAGAGVVGGLTVRRASGAARVTVGDGLAINERGEALELPFELEIPLVEPPDGEQAGTGGEELFADCTPPTPTGAGTAFAGVAAFLLVIGPASGTAGEALHVSADEHGRADVCGPRYAVHGVALRLVGVDLARTSKDAGLTLDPALVDDGTPAGRSRLRNVLAHLCLGTPGSARFYDDPFDAAGAGAYGVVDLLRKDCRLTAGEVPLALTYWTKQGLEFVDMWSVRRRPLTDVAGSSLQTLLRARRRAEAEAAMCQFHDHVKGLVDATASTDLAAAQLPRWFRFLPPAGFVPLALGDRRGFAHGNVFEGVDVHGPRIVSIAEAETLVRAGPGQPAIDLEAEQTLALSLVREVLEAGGGDGSGLSDAPYVLFARPGLDDGGDA